MRRCNRGRGLIRVALVTQLLSNPSARRLGLVRPRKVIIPAMKETFAPCYPVVRLHMRKVVLPRRYVVRILG
jgi:hypothetical protein